MSQQPFDKRHRIEVMIREIEQYGGAAYMSREQDAIIVEGLKLLLARSAIAEPEPAQDWWDIFDEYRAKGRSDAWLYGQIEAHSRRASAPSHEPATHRPEVQECLDAIDAAQKRSDGKIEKALESLSPNVEPPKYEPHVKDGKIVGYALLNAAPRPSIEGTPRTDAAQFDRFPDDSEAETHMVVDADFARKLERQLAEAGRKRIYPMAGVCVVGGCKVLDGFEDVAQPSSSESHNADYYREMADSLEKVLPQANGYFDEHAALLRLAAKALRGMASRSATQDTQDAARYRWLRKEAWVDQVEHDSFYLNFHDVPVETPLPITDAEVDKLVDAAMCGSPDGGVSK